MNEAAMWSEEDSAKLIELDSRGIRVRDIAIRMNKSKNSVAGRLHRIRIKNGHKPKYSRGVKRRYIPEAAKIGERRCNLCHQKFDISSVLQRFCEPCKRTDNYKFGG